MASEKKKSKTGPDIILPRDLVNLQEIKELSDEHIDLTIESYEKYTSYQISEQIEKIFRRHANGEILGYILEDYKSNRDAWSYLLDVNPQLAPRYQKAKMRHQESIHESMLDIADDKSGDTKIDTFGNKVLDKEFVARSQVRLNARTSYIRASKNYGSLYLAQEGNLKKRAEMIVDKMLNGEITQDRAKGVLETLGLFAKIAETFDLIKRVEELEKKANI